MTFLRQAMFGVCAMCFLVGAADTFAHPCLCNGDANLDGVFDEQDFWFTIDCLGQPPVDVCSNADINCDGFINADDIDPDNPFDGDTAIICLLNGTPPEECCPGHVPCGSAVAGDCFEDNGNAACNNLDCCVTVCLSDPFCCDFFWDQFCAMSAELNCDQPGDCDEDGDVDLDDYGVFAVCLTGPGGGPLGDGCACADLDNDGDADLNDFRRFQTLFAGPG